MGQNNDLHRLYVFETENARRKVTERLEPLHNGELVLSTRNLKRFIRAFKKYENNNPLCIKYPKGKPWEWGYFLDFLELSGVGFDKAKGYFLLETGKPLDKSDPFLTTEKK